nr:hypothetical protein [Tanacetum cinerariifolium]
EVAGERGEFLARKVGNGTIQDIPLLVEIAFASPLGFGIVLLGKEEELEVTQTSMTALRGAVGVTIEFFISFRDFSKRFMPDVALKIRDEDTDEVKIDCGGSLSSQILASPSKEKGNSNNLTVVLGTSGCQNVDVTLLKKRR